MTTKARLTGLLTILAAGLAMGFAFASPSPALRAEEHGEDWGEAPPRADREDEDRDEEYRRERRDREPREEARRDREHRESEHPERERYDRGREQPERIERIRDELVEREERLHEHARELEHHERELRERERDLRLRRMEMELDARRMEMERGGLRTFRQISALVEDVQGIAEDPVASAVSATFALEDHVKDPDRAADIYEDLLPEIENETVARAVRLRLVDLCGRIGDHERALRHLRTLIVDVPSDEELDKHDDDEDEIWDEEDDDEYWDDEDDE